MPIVLQSFTTPANTTIVANTAGGTFPQTPVVVTPSATAPFIDGSNAYIWAPNSAANQTVTFVSRFTFPLGLLNVALPVSVNYAFSGTETVIVSGVLEVVNLLGIVIATIPVFTNVVNAGGPLSVEIASGDALLALQLLGTNAVLTITSTVTSGAAGTGNYLGQVTVNEVIAL